MDGKDRIACLQRLFDAQFELGDLEASRDTLRRILCLNGFGEVKDRASALSKLAHLYRRIKKPKLACRVLRDASRFTEGMDKVSILAQLADSELEAGWVDRARTRYRDTLALYHEQEERTGDKRDKKRLVTSSTHWQELRSVLVLTMKQHSCGSCSCAATRIASQAAIVSGC